MACSNGAQSQLAFDDTSTFDSGSEAFPFLYETMQKKGRLIGARGITGSREQSTSQTRLASYTVGGRISQYAAPDLLDVALPRILGASEVATDTFNLSETLPTFSVLIDKVGGVYRYDNCVVSRGFIRAKAGPGDSEPEIVELVQDVLARTETTDGVSWAGTIPDISTGANAAPYILSDSVVTINGAAYPIHDVMIGIDNHIQPRWVNSLTATELCPQDRTIIMQTSNPFTATEYAGLYGLAAAEAGVAATVVFTNGNMSLTFTFTGLQWADNTPVVRGKRQIPLSLSFVARSKAGAASLVVASDSTA